MSQKHDEGSATGTHRPLLRAAFFALLLLLLVAGVESYRDLSVARSEEAALHREIEATRQRVRSLVESVERIENDPATLEQLAREELGFVREGDVVIVLPEEEPPAEAGGDRDQ